MVSPTNNPSRKLPPSVPFKKLDFHAEEAFGQEVAQYLLISAIRNFMNWKKGNPTVCTEKWYINFPEFTLVGEGGIATNLHRVNPIGGLGQTPFVGSWEILQNGTITGKQYGVT